MVELTVDNFLTKKFFSDFNTQSPKSLESLVFIDFGADFALIECPASACLKSALQAFIRAACTQSIRATQTMRCRAFKRVAFCEWPLKFVHVVRLVSAARMGPAGLNFCAADFLGGVLIKSSWWFLLGTPPKLRVTKCRLSICVSENKL